MKNMFNDDPAAVAKLTSAARALEKLLGIPVARRLSDAGFSLLVSGEPSVNPVPAEFEGFRVEQRPAPNSEAEEAANKKKRGGFRRGSKAKKQ